MFPALLQSEQPVTTILVFIGTFFGTIAIGRLLKRRAGVRFGIFFQIFALTLAFYAALSAYGFRTGVRNHVGAVLLLLSTVVVVALLNRYVWEIYFEKKRQTPIPHFLREVVALTIFLTALLLVLSVGYHAQGELKALLAGSGIAAIVLALAAQNLLGGIIAGMSLQISKPYKVGDWCHVAERYAEVMEINWRSTRFRTNDAVYLDIPNNELVRQTIVNLHYPTQIHAMRMTLGVDYAMPPNRVKDALLRATRHAEGVILDPAPKIYVKDFADSAITYEIKFWMGNHAAFNDVTDAIRTNIWYELKRQKISIPFPIRTLHLERKPARPVEEPHEEARTILRTEPLFSCLEDQQLDALLRDAAFSQFGRGEPIIEEAAEGASMFILLRGTAHVSVQKNGSRIRVGVLRAGDCFGEMSLLTGEHRTATVRAEEDCQVVEIGKGTMASLLRDSPGCLNQLSELLASRRLETEGIVKEALASGDGALKRREYSASFARRLRAFFEL